MLKYNFRTDSVLEHSVFIEQMADPSCDPHSDYEMYTYKKVIDYEMYTYKKVILPSCDPHSDDEMNTSSMSLKLDVIRMCVVAASSYVFKHVYTDGQNKFPDLDKFIKKHNDCLCNHIIVKPDTSPIIRLWKDIPYIKNKDVYDRDISNALYSHSVIRNVQALIRYFTYCGDKFTDHLNLLMTTLQNDNPLVYYHIVIEQYLTDIEKFGDVCKLLNSISVQHMNDPSVVDVYPQFLNLDKLIIDINILCGYLNDLAYDFELDTNLNKLKNKQNDIKKIWTNLCKSNFAVS